jgi:hypothetical protein
MLISLGSAKEYPPPDVWTRIERQKGERRQLRERIVRAQITRTRFSGLAEELRDSQPSLREALKLVAVGTLSAMSRILS